MALARYKYEGLKDVIRIHLFRFFIHTFVGERGLAFKNLIEVCHARFELHAFMLAGSSSLRKPH
jgi:hypothetical protein